MPRHQTSRDVAPDLIEDEKMLVFRRYAQISVKVQEYGSAALSAIEAILIIVASCFLYTGTIDVYKNYASCCFIIGQSISLVPNALDMYELVGHITRHHDMWEFTVISHFIVVASYIIGTLLLICGSILTLSWVAIYETAPWIYFSGSVFFAIGAIFGASDGLIHADPFIIFFGALFGKCMIGGTISFLFGSVLGIINLWADEGSQFWIKNIIAGTFQTGGIFFLLGSFFSIIMIIYKNKKREDRMSEGSALINSKARDEH